MPGTSNFGHFDHFSYWKVNFCHFAYQRSVKMPFWPILTPFWALLSQTFGPWPKCAYLGPLPGWTLRDPLGTQIWPYFDHFGPFWSEVWLDPYELPLGWRTCSEPHKPMPGTSNFGHFDHFSYWKSQFLSFCLSGVSENAILTLFWLSFWALLSPNFLALAKMAAYLFLCPEGPWGTLRDPNLTLILTILDPLLRVLREAAARPLPSCLWLETCSEPLKPMPGTLNFGHFDHFSHWPILSFCLSEVSENAILTLFWPILSPPERLLAPGKSAYLFPLPGGTLRDLGTFEGP